MKILIISLILCSSAFGQGKPILGTQMDHSHISGDPVGAWFFLEGSGGQVYDLSGNGNNGTIVSAVTWVPGKYGYALEFAGDNDYVNVLDSDVLRFNSATQDFSVIVWAKSDVAIPDDMLLDKRDNNDDGWVLRTIGGVVWLSINGVDVKGTIDIGDGKWHCIGGAADRSGFGQVYIDGMPDGVPVDVSGQAMNTTGPVRFGILGYGLSNEWVGQISHILIYKRILSVGEIEELYRDFTCMLEKEEVALMTVEVAAPTGSQVIMISTIPLLLVFILKISRKSSFTS